jgi:metal-responsive CopG/Arc/MetJ family transcriptional regulator
MKKLNKKTFSLTLDPEVMDRVDEAAQTFGISRSQMVNNLLEIALMDYDVIKKLKLTNIAKFLSALREGKTTVGDFLTE